MSKAKIYKINKNKNNEKSAYLKNYGKNDLILFTVSIVSYALILMISSALFSGIYVKNFFYALIASLILSFLNATLKPILLYWTLPLTISSLGLLYPITNMIILWLCSVIMGNNFIVGGFFSLFFVSLFISWLRIMSDRIISNNIGGKYE